MLELFFEHPERVLSRPELLARGWGGDEAVEEGNVDNYIYFLRRRLKSVRNARTPDQDRTWRWLSADAGFALTVYAGRREFWKNENWLHVHT